MKGIRILFAALIAVCMVSCVQFKVEATVDVTVLKDGQPQVGVEVYRFNDSSTGYKTNAVEVRTTNKKGIAHFELKSPDDLDPSSIGLVESKIFYFATFDENEDHTGQVSVSVTSGEKNKPVTLVME